MLGLSGIILALGLVSAGGGDDESATSDAAPARATDAVLVLDLRPIGISAEEAQSLTAQIAGVSVTSIET